MEPFDSYEEPLRGAPNFYKPQIEWKKENSMRGPKRAMRMCCLLVVFPGLLIGVPLYLKHHVFAYQMYPMGISDMRLIDTRVSTTWCSSQIIRANTTFNAFLLPQVPNVSRNRIEVSMVRHIELSDDMKEYWGFYLLKGSVVTVSTCVRWPGASLILIRGHRHLHECAYIGDDSSEELEELIEIAEEKGILNLPEISSPESPANRVELLTRHRPEVQFHDQRLRDNAESYTFPPKQDQNKDSEDNISGKRMRELLKLLPHKANKFKANLSFNHTPTGTGNQMNRFRDQLKNEIENRDKQARNGTKEIAPGLSIQEFIKRQQADHIHKVRETNIGKHETENVELVSRNNMTKDDDKQVNDNAKRTSSSDLSVEDVLKKINKLNPDKRNQLLNLLRNNATTLDNGDIDSILASGANGTTEKPVKKLQNENVRIEGSIEDEVEILDMDEPKMGKYKRKRKGRVTTTMPQQETKEERLLRLKRELILKPLEKELNSAADEGENLGIEQGYTPDGIADHHQILNHTNLNDRSNSEYWSSFSSSEEALLNCTGLILSLPLTPHSHCNATSDDDKFSKASHTNTITYTVPVNGYYFFVFNSENEKQDNYIRVKFDLQKTVYNVTNPIYSCNNITNECKLPLHFFSNEKVVFELPVNNNETLWNEEFIVVSECEPRTAIYLICVISVPLMVLLFAFQ